MRFNFTLNGLFLTVPTSVEQAVNIEVTENENVEVNCTVTAGIPAPTVIWTKAATGERIEGNPLNITSINRAQAGEYKCTANNTCGVDSTVVDINVQCKNHAIVIFLLKLLVIKLTFTCTVVHCF